MLPFVLAINLVLRILNLSQRTNHIISCAFYPNDSGAHKKLVNNMTYTLRGLACKLQLKPIELTVGQLASANRQTSCQRRPSTQPTDTPAGPVGPVGPSLSTISSFRLAAARAATLTLLCVCLSHFKMECRLRGAPLWLSYLVCRLDEQRIFLQAQ